MLYFVIQLTNWKGKNIVSDRKVRKKGKFQNNGHPELYKNSGAGVARH